MAKLSLTEFADKMNEIMPVIAREFIKNQINDLYKGKVTLPQFLILEFLHREGEAKMTLLARFMDVSTAAMTGIVERLVRGGYAARVYDRRDRRIIKVKLTQKGNELVGKIGEQRRNLVIKIFGKISEADRQDYLRILMQIKDTLLKSHEIK